MKITDETGHRVLAYAHAAETQGVRRLTASDEGRISPAWAEIDDPGRFIPPLTEGERRLARFLDDVLPQEWNIYVRPHLDADRPLIAALHRTAGGMFWDVVDWDVTRYRVDGGVWVGEGPIEGRFASPFRFLNDVRARVYGVYAPEIGEAINDEMRRFGVLTSDGHVVALLPNPARVLGVPHGRRVGLRWVGSRIGAGRHSAPHDPEDAYYHKGVS